MRDQRWMGVVMAACLALALWLTAWPVLADNGGSTAIFFDNYTLGPGERLDHDLIVVGGQAHLKPGSLVEGDVLVAGGQAILEGRIRGDVLILGGLAELAATATIDKDLVVLGQLRRDPEAKVRGNIVESWGASGALSSASGILSRQGRLQARSAPSPTRLLPRFGWPGKGLLASLASILTLLLAAALLIALLPEGLRRITQAMEQQIVFCTGVGLLTLTVVAIGSVILAITCIGIPLVLALGLALLAAGLAGWVAAGQVVGRRVLRALQAQNQPPLVEVAVGVVLLGLASKVPCVGWLASLLALSWGLGAVVLTRFGTKTYPLSSPYEPFPSPAPPAPMAGPFTGGSAPRRGDTRPLDERTLE